MNTNDIAEQIRYLIESEPGRQWRARDIGDILGFRGHRARHMNAALSDLVEEGALKQVRPGVFALGGQGLARGRLELVRSGAGFVTDAETGRTYRVDARDVGDALPGDMVSVRVLKNGADADTARVVRVEKRADRLVVGTFYTSGKIKFVVPLDPVYRNDIAIADAAGAKEGDRVVVRFAAPPVAGAPATGEIVDVIGPADKPSLDTEVVCRQYELPGDFPAAVLEEASAAEGRLRRPGKRLDLRKAFILTVDPASARDYDDAISLDVRPDGTRTLGVHIADVGFFVREGSALDREAAERGTSVYLVDKVIPMLPEQLSNGVCSLRPDEDRLCLSVFIDFDEAGRPTGRRFARSKIRSKLRLNYEQALAIIEGRKPEGLDNCPPEAEALLKGCAALATQLRQARMKSGALDLDLPECEIQLDAESRMTGVKVVEYDLSHQMIEECMVAANEAVAAELSSRGIRILSRLHEPPDPTKIDDLIASLRAIGFRPGDIHNAKNLSAFIASIADSPLRATAHTLILRSMKRAVYSAEGMGHFGLAKHFYSHFTSPIRRYPDLILHRQLAGLLDPESGAARAPDGYLRKMAVQCTEREQRADDAERALLEIKKYRYLKQVLDEGNGETFDAVVSKVTSYGLFVDLPALQVGGLVHIGSISRSFVRFNRGANALSADGRSYGVGDELKVVVANVDFLQRKLDFAIVREKVPEKTPGKGAKGRKASKTRKTPEEHDRAARPARGNFKGRKNSARKAAGPRQKRARRH